MSTVPFPSPPLCREKIERIHLPIFIPEPHSHTSLADVSTPFLAFSPVLKPSSPARAFEPRCSPTTIRASFLHINQLLANREEWGSSRVRKIQTSPFLPSFYHHLSRRAVSIFVFVSSRVERIWRCCRGTTPHFSTLLDDIR